MKRKTHRYQVGDGMKGGKGAGKMEMMGVVFNNMNSEEVHWVHVLQRNAAGGGKL